jgi:hypothetical protein
MIVQRTVAAAVVGGTTSEIAGGKFANGAATAAMVHLFNAEGNHGAVEEDVEILGTAVVAVPSEMDALEYLQSMELVSETLEDAFDFYSGPKGGVRKAFRGLSKAWGKRGIKVQGFVEDAFSETLTTSMTVIYKNLPHRHHTFVFYQQGDSLLINTRMVPLPRDPFYKNIGGFMPRVVRGDATAQKQLNAQVTRTLQNQVNEITNR